MKKIMLLSLLTTFSFLGRSQEKYSKYDYLFRYNNTIYTLNFDHSKQILFEYLDKMHINTSNKTETTRKLSIEFMLSASQYKSLDTLVKQLGYSTACEVISNTSSTRFNELTMEVEYLKKQRISYLDLLEKVDTKSDKYLVLWNENKRIESDLFEKEKLVEKIKNSQNYYLVDIDLNDDAINEENSKISFVNMPGAEYSLLKIASPTHGISNNLYQGYFMKYLFTKGKSYASLGAYTPVSKNHADSTQFSELFMLSFGQDFYSRHLGRGSRKFFNLYTGYQFGGVLASGEKTKSNFFYIAPSIGVELYKNKNILIDSKVNYFLPFEYNQELRGVSYNLSFNFVF